jgi:hypothetical protein
MRTLLLLLICGCTRPNLSIDDCSSHKDEVSCVADSRCQALVCGGCQGSTGAFACYAKGSSPPFECPDYYCPASCHGLDAAHCAVTSGCVVFDCCGSYQGCLDPGEAHGCTCISCQGLDEATCKARSDCRADYCPDCNGGQTYAGCGNSTDPPNVCGAPPCPVGCSNLTADECSLRSDCHSVFQPGACGCAACCCVFFSSCADGKANCTGPAACDISSPDCDPQDCNGQYVVAYSNACYEGCVLASDCQ